MIVAPDETASPSVHGRNGLAADEAARRLAVLGPNQLAPAQRRALALEFLARFRNPLVLLLLVASGMAALTGDVASFVIIVTMVLVSVTLDFVQEHRAGQAAERLKASVALHASVVRDGVAHDVPVANVVEGDVVLLSAGDLVPADGLVVEARDLFLNQALLTGEAYPVEKHPAADGAFEPNPEQTRTSVFMGTSVVSGTATIEIARTGPRTALGGIAAAVGAKPPPTAFEQGTQAFGLFIMRITLVLVLGVLLANTALHRPPLESFLFALALAVGLTPELLPMIVSVCLARGALRMAEQKVVVKRLAAIHDLGSMDVLCTDKTGTLTEARIRLEQHLDALGRDRERVLQLAYVNSFFETGLRSPLDAAILEHANDVSVVGWEKIDEVPFDFERRRVSVLVDDGRERLLVVKGAFEDVLRLSTQYEHDGPDDLRPLDASMRAQVVARFEALGSDGFRVLGIAWKVVERTHGHAVVDDETALVLAGLAAFLDPPKASAAHAIASLEAVGIAIKVVTGDNEMVTRHVCAELGLPVHAMRTGTEIAAMDEQALEAVVDDVTLFCRVTPAQKNRVILALKRRGHVVGYLGDGINDAPPLHSADVGISVKGAVDVAQEAAALILLEHDLGVLHAGVMEGRRTFGNVMKYVMMGTSSNFGNMFSMAAATLVLPFLPMLPVQILLNNLLYDVSELPIPTDEVDAEELRHPRRWDMAFVRRFMLMVGPVSSVFDFLTFFLMLHVFHANEALFHTGWFVESLTTQVLVIFVIRTRRNPLRSRPARWLVVTSLAVVASAMLLPLTPFGARLGFVPPPVLFYPALACMSGLYLIAAEVMKRRFYARA
jgi:Mg2+-importing ATPase